MLFNVRNLLFAATLALFFAAVCATDITSTQFIKIVNVYRVNNNANLPALVENADLNNASSTYVKAAAQEESVSPSSRSAINEDLIAKGYKFVASEPMGGADNFVEFFKGIAGDGSGFMLSPTYNLAGFARDGEYWVLYLGSK
ncbi:hypothetical protein EV175_001370 [Coemansia sp. RSA 1933]|nr:hypothetical protein EV175_001370 [Coemansia sp. RSA 1933]